MGVAALVADAADTDTCDLDTRAADGGLPPPLATLPEAVAEGLLLLLLMLLLG